MGIAEKIDGAKRINWPAESLSKAEIKTIVDLAQISAQIERRRIDMGMNQKEFAEFLGVTQGMVSKWESQEYNFTVRALNEIGQKVGLSFRISSEQNRTGTYFNIVRWSEEKPVRKDKMNIPKVDYSAGEGIA